MASTVDTERLEEFHEDDFKSKTKKLAKMVTNSKYTVFFTGAGVSTSAGVNDYRGPTGAWTTRRLRDLEGKLKKLNDEEKSELELLRTEAKKKAKTKKVDMMDAEPTLTHMAMSTLIRKKMAHYVVTTNLDGIHRKSGLQGHTQVSNLHGCVYTERCTNPKCGYEFERNFHVRVAPGVHDHTVARCEKCKSYKRKLGKLGTNDENQGTKDTHINFGECLDEIEWDEADMHCRKADLCIVAGTSMSLRHITHFPFLAKETVIINLQKTPDDDKCDLRIFATTDVVFEHLMEQLGVPVDPIPMWRPRDALPLHKLRSRTGMTPYYLQKAINLEETAKFRESEALARNKAAKVQQAKQAKQAMQAKPTELKEAQEGSVSHLEEGLHILAVEEVKQLDQVNEPKLSLPSPLTTVLVGNTHQEIAAAGGGQNKHKWTAFVKVAKVFEELVDHVDFHLHPTFSPSVVSVSQAPFQVQRVGWGYFEVGVVLYWKVQANLEPTVIKHELDFGKPETCRSVPLPKAPSGGVTGAATWQAHLSPPNSVAVQ